VANNFTRSPINVTATFDTNSMLKRYKNMLTNVSEMINKDGYIYSVWIYFQIGLNEKNSVKFNTATQNIKQNLIASLNIDKTGAGVANSFTLNIQYDPFNYGQNTKDTIELLEEFIANAMAENFDSDTTACRGKIQYGYNSTSDNTLVSPLYEFFLTSATTDIMVDSGIITYTFTGTSVIASDCDYTTTYPAINKVPVLKVVAETLYKYYGDSNNKPDCIKSSNITPEENDYKYRIDIDTNLMNSSEEVEEEEVKSDTLSPIMYCKNLLDKYPLTKAEKASGLYENLDEKSVNLQPKWILSMTDQAGAKAIHITHMAPKSTKSNSVETYTEKNPLSLNYTFTWGVKTSSGTPVKSLVVGWKPEVDLYTYLIRKALVKRHNRLKQLAMEEDDPNGEYNQKYNLVAESIQDTFREMYNAEIQLVGIPADPPLTAEVTIEPYILESVSRTAGVYIITGASDTISTRGTYVSNLKLFRVRSTEARYDDILNKQNTATSTTANTTANNTYTNKTAPTGFVGPVIWDETDSRSGSTTYTREVQPSEIQKLIGNVTIVNSTTASKQKETQSVLSQYKSQTGLINTNMGVSMITVKK